MIDPKALAALVAGVPNQDAVYTADLAQTETPSVVATPVTDRIETADEKAIDGVAYHVFNTLRGVEDTVDGATFDDVRAVVVALRAAV